MEESFIKVTSNIKKLQTKYSHKVQLVAVSKLKPISDIIKLYEMGQRNFGENYVGELIEKSQLLNQYKDIKWHFIGHLQSNKVVRLLEVKNLEVIETIHNIKIAEEINKKCKNGQIINVFLQVNTSKEKNKHGIDKDDVLMTANYIFENLKNLKIKDCKQNLINNCIYFKNNHIELSMGMSNDYECAIKMGSTNVRIGSLLLGERI